MNVADDDPRAPELSRLRRENEELARRCGELGRYLRSKLDQLLVMMGSKPMDASDLDDVELVALDPIGTLTEALGQMRENCHAINDALRAEIAERKRTEAALRESEEKFRTLAEFSTSWVFWRAPDGSMIYVSPAAEQLTGYTAAEFMSQPDLVERVIHEEDRARWIDHRHQADAQGVPAPIDFRIVTKGGEIRWISHVCRAVYGDDGEFLGVRGSNRDVTLRKKQEDHLLKARKLESIGILAGGIAHDFNNILTGILGNLSLARMLAESGGDVSCCLAEAEKASLRAKELTRRLLTFAKGGAPVREPTDVAQAVRDAVSLAVRGSDIAVRFLLDADLPQVSADRDQLAQALGHVLENAVQAMPYGGTVTLRASMALSAGGNVPGLRDGRFVRISVEDQGSGIPREHLHKVFDPFFSTRREGKGLGLPTAFSIVQAHEGLITVESEPGRGTSVHIYLPAEAPEPPSRAAGPERRTTGRILVMDDEDLVREVAIKMLENLGYRAYGAQDGAEALEAWRAAREAGDPFDAVIMDITVPGGMGGKEAVRRLLESDPEARAIVSSGYSDDPVMANHERHGFRGVIAKPYTVGELRRVIAGVLSS